VLVSILDSGSGQDCTYPALSARSVLPFYMAGERRLRDVTLSLRATACPSVALPSFLDRHHYRSQTLGSPVQRQSLSYALI
jgi:hypothetical protein